MVLKIRVLEFTSENKANKYISGVTSIEGKLKLIKAQYYHSAIGLLILLIRQAGGN